MLLRLVKTDNLAVCLNLASIHHQLTEKKLSLVFKRFHTIVSNKTED